MDKIARLDYKLYGILDYMRKWASPLLVVRPESTSRTRAVDSLFFHHLSRCRHLRRWWPLPRPRFCLCRQALPQFASTTLQRARSSLTTSDRTMAACLLGTENSSRLLRLCLRNPAVFLTFDCNL